MPHSVAVIGGDGIGPEVLAQALKVVAAAGVRLETTEYELGAAHYLRTGEVLADETLEALRRHDAILLGAVGPPVGSTEVPSGLLERGLLLRLRFALDCYVNLRPFNGVPGSIAAGRDFVVVRENTEGPYAGEGGQLRRGTPHEVATQGSVNTRFGVERCVRFAFDLAERRHGASGGPEQHAPLVTLVHKTNVLTYAGDLWSRVVSEVGEEHPRVARQYQHVDAATIYLVTDPGRYDVIVTDNLFGDIITDLAGAVTGGIGLAASANLNPARTGPSLFEPVHGAAHDIAGTGTANPCAAIRSAAMMLEHLGETEAAARITAAVLAQQVEMALDAPDDLPLHHRPDSERPQQPPARDPERSGDRQLDIQQSVGQHRGSGQGTLWETASIGDAVARRL
jgi:3-isopropylmalate dehydrogenase